MLLAIEYSCMICRCRRSEKQGCGRAYSRLPSAPQPLYHPQLIHRHASEQHFRRVCVRESPCQKPPPLSVLPEMWIRLEVEVVFRVCGGRGERGADYVEEKVFGEGRVGEAGGVHFVRFWWLVMGKEFD